MFLWLTPAETLSSECSPKVCHFPQTMCDRLMCTSHLPAGEKRAWLPSHLRETAGVPLWDSPCLPIPAASESIQARPAGAHVQDSDPEGAIQRCGTVGGVQEHMVGCPLCLQRANAGACESIRGPRPVWTLGGRCRSGQCSRAGAGSASSRPPGRPAPPGPSSASRLQWGHQSRVMRKPLTQARPAPWIAMWANGLEWCLVLLHVSGDHAALHCLALPFWKRWRQRSPLLGLWDGRVRGAAPRGPTRPSWNPSWVAPFHGGQALRAVVQEPGW